MGDLYIRVVNDLIALADASGQVQVFAAEGEALIPAAASDKDISRQEHGCSHQHLHRPRGFGVKTLTPVTAVAGAQKAGPAQEAGAMEERAGRRTLAVRDLRLALGIAQSRAHHAHFRMGFSVIDEAA